MHQRMFASSICLLALACSSNGPGGDGSETGFVETETPLAAAELTPDDSGGSGSDGGAAEVRPYGSCEEAIEVFGIDRVWTIPWMSTAPLYPSATCGDGTNPPSSPGTVVKWTAPVDSDGLSSTLYAFASNSSFEAVFQGLQCPDATVGVHSNGCGLVSSHGSPTPASGFNLTFQAGDVLYFTFQWLDLDDGPMPESGTIDFTIAPSPPW